MSSNQILTIAEANMPIFKRERHTHISLDEFTDFLKKNNIERWSESAHEEKLKREQELKEKEKQRMIYREYDLRNYLLHKKGLYELEEGEIFNI